MQKVSITNVKQLREPRVPNPHSAGARIREHRAPTQRAAGPDTELRRRIQRHEERRHLALANRRAPTLRAPRPDKGPTRRAPGPEPRGLTRSTGPDTEWAIVRPET